MLRVSNWNIQMSPSSSTLNTDVNWCLDFLTQVGMMFSLIDFSVKLGQTRFGEWVNCRVTFESLVTGKPLEFDLPCGQVGGLGVKL